MLKMNETQKEKQSVYISNVTDILGNINNKGSPFYQASFLKLNFPLVLHQKHP